MEPRQIQLRYDTAANWTAANPVLAAGEAGFETDTNKIKVGDGVKNWLMLPYLAGEGGGGGGGGSGDGDMKKAVYDVNNNGIVDKAQSVPWSGVSDVPSATTGQSGIVQLATVDNLLSENLAATPAGVKAAVDAIPSASTTTPGLIRLATHSEIEAGTSVDLAVSPKEMADAIGSIGSAQSATETTPGIARIATQSEVNAGALDNAIVTPKKVKSVLDSLAFSSWRPVCPPLGNFIFHGIDHNESGVIVAVGDGGRIFSSLDHGLTWNQRASGVADNLQAVRHGGGTWVAVGDNSAIVTSSDGVNWTKRNADLVGSLSCIDYGNGVWIAGGNGLVVRSSSSASSWSTVQINSGERMTSVCYLFSSIWLVSSVLNSRPRVWKTTNGGSGWAMIEVSSSYSNNPILAKVPDGVLMISQAYTNPYISMHVYKSQDSGNSWERVISPFAFGSAYDSIMSALLKGQAVLVFGYNGVVIEVRDGVASRKTLGFSYSLYDACDTGQRVLVCGNNGTILTPVFPAG